MKHTLKNIRITIKVLEKELEELAKIKKKTCGQQYNTQHITNILGYFKAIEILEQNKLERKKRESYIRDCFAKARDSWIRDEEDAILESDEAYWDFNNFSIHIKGKNNEE